ncbi:hypothetical protein HKBW3S25_01425, partial [Candidatus Hakubella thermalkaliphila]
NSSGYLEDVQVQLWTGSWHQREPTFCLEMVKESIAEKEFHGSRVMAA